MAALRAFEEERRRATDFARQPTADLALGPNPYQVERLPGSDRAVGLLRGAAAVVLLDAGGRELARTEAPPSPTALAIDASERIWIGGTGSDRIDLVRAGPRGLERVASRRLDGCWTVRALAAGESGWMYAADERSGRVVGLPPERPGDGVPSRDLGPGDGIAARQVDIGRCHGPVQLATVPGYLVANCLLDHTLVAYPLEAGRPTAAAPVRIAHDGPFWSVAAVRAGERILLAAGGVEDHPLERENGGFGYIDSFLYLWALPAPGAGARAHRLATIDLSALGVVTPKWLTLEVEADGAVVVQTAGYAGSVLATLRWTELGGGAPEVVTRELAPGTTDLATASRSAPAILASPLLDAWLVDRGAGAVRVTVADPAGRPARSAESRIGEALFFTTLLAPWSSSEGKRSRFTCETCHFEAMGDGRIHFTGRDAVHSTTKPLRGLFNNRPHFTRALDRTMAGMVDAEFRVANRWNGRDPWFSLDAGDVPWLSAIQGIPPTLTPVYLRRAFMSFLMELSFEPNQAARGRRHFDRREAAGAAVFLRRCEGCHRARLVTEDPTTGVPFGRWEDLLFSPAAPIVWASAEYRKTGIMPYVHPDGARTTSLRRIWQKYPYFTSGSARSLAEVVARAAWIGDRFWHDAGTVRGPVSRLTGPDRAALLAFLELL